MTLTIPLEDFERNWFLSYKNEEYQLEGSNSISAVVLYDDENYVVLKYK